MLLFINIYFNFYFKNLNVTKLFLFFNNYLEIIFIEIFLSLIKLYSFFLKLFQLFELTYISFFSILSYISFVYLFFSIILLYKKYIFLN